MSYYITTNARPMPRRWVRQETNALPVQVRDDSDAFVLTALVPGLKAEDLKIQIMEDVLRIDGVYSQHEGDYLLSEIPAGEFSRTLRLPTELDADRAEAHIENGILTLRLPKAETSLPKLIKVEAR